MATQAQINAVSNLHAFGNRAAISATYNKEMGYDIDHTDPYELAQLQKNATANGMTFPTTDLEAMVLDTASFSGTDLTMTWTLNDGPLNVESIAIYIWNVTAQDGKWHYVKRAANGTGATIVDAVVGDAGDYKISVESEAFAPGVKSVRSNELTAIIV